MIRKALENSIYAEMWLYLCLFFVCGWRAKDVTRNWQYPELYKQERVIPCINPETLFNDILNGQIQEETRRTVCQSAILRIDLANVFASKTIEHSHQPLSVLIPPELQAFFGLLTLIAECHRLRSKNGYMNENRTEDYQNKMKLRAFFGQTIYEILHGKNISSLKLNKDFLQGIQQAGRKKGLNGIQTSMLAAYARNHTGLGSISHYLQDGNLSQETAEMVLYCMMERGVFGFQIYRTLLTAYPESMSSLSTKKQTEIIKMMKSSPLRIETEHAGLVAQQSIEAAFKAGDTAESLRLLHNMLTISQQRGSGKDHGVYCLKRAEGEACSYPEYESCFVCCCEDLVFTRYGLLPLIDILNDFYMKAQLGDKKSEGVLMNVLIPRYQAIINQLIANSVLSKDERQGIKRLIENKLFI